MAKANTGKAKYTLKRGLIVFGLVFLFILTVGAFSRDQINLSGSNQAFANSQSLVSIFADGQKRTVATSANTVGEALEKNGVTLGQGDVVEPSADQPLSSNVTNINIYRARPYLIVDGGKATTILSGYRSPRSVIERNNITLYPEDVVTPELQNEHQMLSDGSVGEKLVIQRATPVTVVLAGKTFNVRTQKSTVADLLAEKGLTVQPNDVITPGANAKLVAGMKIAINRVDQKIVAEQQTIEPEIQYVTDDSKPVGYSEVRDPGAPGQKTLTFTITMQNGAEQSRQLLQEAVDVAPKTKVVVIGPVSVAAQNAHNANTSGWAALRNCESGGNYANKNNPLYRGAYQFSYSTWGNYGGYRDPADAPPAVQDAKAQATYAVSGSSPWPICGRFLR
ncbi:DUF348 domain-containing protein [Candidatus Saccharibacteria bacterium]|nr:DUF348 domain-containing protein [Candidatus Saccharibacteria bacterium]